MTRVRWIHAAWIVAMTVGLTGASCVVKDSAKGPAVATTAAVRVAYGQLPLSFEANQGQTGRQVQFLSRGRGYNLFLTPTEAVLALRSAAQAPGTESGARGGTGPQQIEEAEGAEQTNAAVLRMKLLGANPNPTVMGLDELPGKANYFIGNDPSKWRTNVPVYAKVKYQEVYPGVDLISYGNQRQLEYDFVVARAKVAIVSGTGTVSADASDNVGVAGVQ